MLGYEPTTVQSCISLLDYSKCAFDLGLTPAEFLDQHNPMFPDGQALLANYTTNLTAFDHTCFQIVIINNSSADVGGNRLQGILHTAGINNPDPNKSRIVNSTMIGCGKDWQSVISRDDIDDFVSTEVIRQATYQ